MPCPRCGQATAPGAPFCAACGQNLAAALPVGAMPQMPMMAAQRTSGMAIAGFVLSFFCGLLGLIFSIMGRNECKRSNGSVGGAGLALAGIIISILHLVATALYALLVVVLVHGGMQSAKATLERTDREIKQLDEASHKMETAMQEIDSLSRQGEDAEQA